MQRLGFHKEVEMASGRKVRAEEALELLERWEQSGERMSTWCAARGLNWYSLSAYKGWLFTRWDDEPGKDLVFAEVVVGDVEASATQGGRYRIELGAVVLEVDDAFRDDTLRRLLRVVSSC